MVAEIIIGTLIAAYCIFLIVRRIKKIKKGEWCDCDNCSGCGKRKEDK